MPPRRLLREHGIPAAQHRQRPEPPSEPVRSRPMLQRGCADDGEGMLPESFVAPAALVPDWASGSADPGPAPLRCPQTRSTLGGSKLSAVPKAGFHDASFPRPSADAVPPTATTDEWARPPAAGDADALCDAPTTPATGAHHWDHSYFQKDKVPAGTGRPPADGSERSLGIRT